jgi:hypothetical protein
MFIAITILLALGLGWLAERLIKSYPRSPHPRRFARLIRPLTNLADKLIKKIKVQFAKTKIRL